MRHFLSRYTERVLALATTPNTLVGVPGGTAAYVAMQAAVGVNSVVFQPVINVDEGGHFWGTKPTYMAWTLLNTLAPANKTPWAFYNGSASGQTCKVEAIIANKSRRAITGLNFGLNIARITSLGPVGTGLGSAGGAGRTIFALDPRNATLTNTIWFTEQPSSNNIGGVSSLFTKYMHSEETDTAAAVAEAFPLWPPAGIPFQIPQALIVPPGYGLRSTHAESAAGEYIHGLIFTVSSG